jgi:hypothetical protein
MTMTMPEDVAAQGLSAADTPESLEILIVDRILVVAQALSDRFPEWAEYVDGEVVLDVEMAALVAVEAIMREDIRAADDAR